MREKILSMISNNNLDISYLGDVPDLREVLATTQIFVCPSRSVSEGFPMSICEAGFERNLIIRITSYNVCYTKLLRLLSSDWKKSLMHRYHVLQEVRLCLNSH